MPCACCDGRVHVSDAFDPFIDTWNLFQKCRLDNSLSKFKLPTIGPDSSGWELCRLQALPAECYQQCLQYLDLGALTIMRRVSQFTRLAISSLPQYRELFENAPQALRACLVSGVASHIPLLRLHHALTSMECHYCKMEDPTLPTFGNYLSLFEGRRACLFCLRNSTFLLPVDLKALFPLFLGRNASAIKPLTSLCSLTTVPGVYGNTSTYVHNINTVVQASAVSNGKPLNDRENRVLFGRIEAHGPQIWHHPLVHAKDESDIKPQHYVDPTSPKRVLLMYQTAVSFPYLSTGKQISDYGTMCGDCILHMQWEETRWTNEQRIRARQGISPHASDRIRSFINHVRRRGCATYSISPEADRDAEVISQRVHALRLVIGKDEDERLDENGEKEAHFEYRGVSIQEHREFHVREVIPQNEREYRDKMKATTRAAPPAPPRPT